MFYVLPERWGPSGRSSSLGRTSLNSSSSGKPDPLDQAWTRCGEKRFEQIFERVETNSRPDVPLTISSMQVSLYIPMGQLYFGVFTWNNKQMITFHKENLWKTLKDEDDNFALSNYWKKRTNWRRLLQILRQHCFNHENGMDFMTNSIFANKIWHVCVYTRVFI